MGPKKVLSAEEGDDIKKSLEFMTEEISAVKLQMKAILDLVEEVKALRIQNAEKDRRLAYLENRVADLEQYTRINDVIITGLRIKPRSYARAVAADNVGGPGEEDVNSTELQVVIFLRSKGVEVDYNNIEACHPLPRKNDSDKPAIIVRFANRKHKTALLKQGKKLKGSDVFMNEHLTKRNADIARKARYLKKQGKIQNTWTTNCKVFIKLNGTPEQAKVLVIRNMEELDKY
ncbi:SH2 domain protein 2A [Sarotherodon galilaeus]